MKKTDRDETALFAATEQQNKHCHYQKGSFTNVIPLKNFKHDNQIFSIFRNYKT